MRSSDETAGCVIRGEAVNGKLMGNGYLKVEISSCDTLFRMYPSEQIPNLSPDSLNNQSLLAYPITMIRAFFSSKCIVSFCRNEINCSKGSPAKQSQKLVSDNIRFICFIFQIVWGNVFSRKRRYPQIARFPIKSVILYHLVIDADASRKARSAPARGRKTTGALFSFLSDT